jgi:hypothetical protein
LTGITLMLEAAMVPFAGLLAALEQIPDPRRRQGRRYPLAHLLLFSVLAVLAGATCSRRSTRPSWKPPFASMPES